ncbi:helix-hairpin-helix domain-containing protein [Natronosalvus rutilus]|uniref:Helix-hairpin-helix domain-containing protein n=1 Tax=Natronosalvus rutilus TaxID=2953753 RepID=A0A9E7SYI0_9EURY|nr:helix-hairpin-helix domain-containing protein [Natronosalvus rutilus]UTF56036.1 helix-hairpin-helix domain-containing protein [Natronosalvus rutilus]
MSELADRLEEVNGIGEATAAVIAGEFDSTEELREVVTDIPAGYSPARLSKLDGFSPDRARKLAIAIDEAGVLETPDLLWGAPGNAHVQHIFGEDGRSLCGKYGFYPTGRGTPVQEGAAYVDGEDCKECCRKADPVTVDAEGGEDDE